MKLIHYFTCGCLLLILGFQYIYRPHLAMGTDRQQEPGFISKTEIQGFTERYTEYTGLRNSLEALYAKDSSFIWYDENGLKDFGPVLYNDVNRMDLQGLPVSFPYPEKYSELFFGNQRDVATFDNELLISALYIYYHKKVYVGLDQEQSRRTGWHLPREKVCLAEYPDFVNGISHESFWQYDNLKKGLKKYLEIREKGGWDSISLRREELPLKPGDTSETILQLRKRLFIEGYIGSNSGSRIYDRELAEAVAAYRKGQFKSDDVRITDDLISDLNIGVSERIMCIAANMERCRWVPADMNDAEDYIAVNIPSFRLHYISGGEPLLVSRVVVGKEATKTVVFSGELEYIAFSPYWNIPSSILQNEILPAVRKDSSYLESHQMEWVGSRLRQKPGANNPLGLVKFMFPNANNIYLHDTPAKSLFHKDERAFSHGCIRVEKAKELAIAIIAKDGGWNAEKVDAAMNSGVETSYLLKKAIPVYIAYFTAWADQEGNVVFFDDLYNRDKKLAALLFEQ